MMYCWDFAQAYMCVWIEQVYCPIKTVDEWERLHSRWYYKHNKTGIGHSSEERLLCNFHKDRKKKLMGFEWIRHSSHYCMQTNLNIGMSQQNFWQQ